MDEFDLENIEKYAEEEQHEKQRNHDRHGIKKEEHFDNNDDYRQHGIKREEGYNNNNDSEKRYVNPYEDRDDDRRRKKSKKSKHSSRRRHYDDSRSRSRSRSSSSYNSNHNNNRDDPHNHHHRHSGRYAPLSEEEQQRIENEQKKRELEEELRKIQEQFKQAQKEAEEAQREDMTVMFYCLPLNAKEYDVFKFIYDNKVGKIRDIRLIKEPRTGKSKGVCYVEFFDRDSIQQCIQLDTRPFIMDGKEVMYSQVRISHSQAEKNRAAAAAKQLKEQKAKEIQTQLQQLQDAPMKIFIGGLTDNLATISDSYLKEIFEVFGDIEQVEVSRDQSTGRCKGYAYITYARARDAEIAIEKMNNHVIGDKQIKVTSLTQSLDPTMPLLQLTPAQIEQHQALLRNQQQSTQISELDEDDPNNYLHSAQQRERFYAQINRDGIIQSKGQKQQQQEVEKSSQNQGDIYSNPELLQTNPLLQSLLQKDSRPSHHPPKSEVSTSYLFIGNMFTGDEVQNEPDFFFNLREDVEEECGRFGAIDKIHVDQNSKGNIFVKFSDTQAAQKCCGVMKQRYYNSQKIESYCIDQKTFNAQLSKHEQ